MSKMQTPNVDCRSMIGKINLLATQTRPDLSYAVSDVSSKLKSGIVEVIKSINKVIWNTKKEASIINIPILTDATRLSLVGYSDASFSNLSDGGSKEGYITFVIDSNGMHVAIAWQSRRARLVKSIQAAETLAIVDAAEACVYYRTVVLNLLGGTKPHKFHTCIHRTRRWKKKMCVVNFIYFYWSKSLAAKPLKLTRLSPGVRSNPR